MNDATPAEFWKRKSWVESANDTAVGFPLQSLPYCSFVPQGGMADAHLGVGIGTCVLDLYELSRSGLLTGLNPDIHSACAAAQLNQLMRCGPAAWASLRNLLIELLAENAGPGHCRVVESLVLRQDEVRFLKPVEVGSYTDFYASIHHATNVGRLFRPNQPLLPNYKWIPIGYHGRASSFVVSGTDIHRPQGQFTLPDKLTPVFGPTKQLDYELEVAAYIGVGSQLGTPIPIAAANLHVFGLSLLNDWSARDIQAWESQPLGPFLGKSFATSISPWVVPTDALLPFRTHLAPRQFGDPEPLPYLAEDATNLAEAVHAQPSGIDLVLEVSLSTFQMREAKLGPVRLSRANLSGLYWSFPQMIAHHTSNGCNLVEGDVLASGTVSGPESGSQGCLLEITQRGASPLHLPNGETRAFLEDGDEVILKGFCEGAGYPRISFGECRGTVLPPQSAG